MEFQYDPTIYSLLPETGLLGESGTNPNTFQSQTEDFTGFEFTPFDNPGFGPLFDREGDDTAVRPAIPEQLSLLDMPLPPLTPSSDTLQPTITQIQVSNPSYTIGDHLQAPSARPQPQQKALPLSHFIVDGRPAPPAELALHLNPSHIPYSHGRCPDRRGLKDTTIANDYYYSLATPEPFTLPGAGKDITYRGPEFDKGVCFKSRELIEYLRVCPRRPTLRIQFQPAQYNHRYMRGGASFKCRLDDCPSKTRTILKGQPRVALHEFEDENGDWLNPYATAAGYVHLYCLEQALNFTQLCQHPQVTVICETRKLAHEPVHRLNPRVNNPMALNEEEVNVVDVWRGELGARWTRFCATYPDAKTRPKWELENKDRLFHRLTAAHIDGNEQYRRTYQKRKQEAVESGAASAYLAEFYGDVSKQVSLQKDVFKRNTQLRIAAAAHKERSAKRMRIEVPAPEGEVGYAGLPSLDFTGIDDFLPSGVGGFHFPQEFPAPSLKPADEYSYFPPGAQAPAPLLPVVLDETNRELIEPQQQPTLQRTNSSVSSKTKTKGKSPTSQCALKLSNGGSVVNTSSVQLPENWSDDLDSFMDPGSYDDFLAELGAPNAQPEGSPHSPVLCQCPTLSSKPTTPALSPFAKQPSDAALKDVALAALNGELDVDGEDEDSLFGDFE